jgi:predicted O-methyltransferase YrrM
MKPSEPIQRRDFLRATGGAVGLAGLLSASGFSAEKGGVGSVRTRGQVEKLFADLEGQGRPYYALPRSDGQLLHLLIKATQAKNVLELGTVHGFAALWMGLALEETGGQLTTIEILEDRHALARRLLADAGLASRVTCKRGNAHELVPTLKGPFDFVFLNADKDGQVDYFQKLHPQKLAPGALLVAYSALRRAEKMKDYLDLMARHPDFDSAAVNAAPEEGFLLSYRRRA